MNKALYGASGHAIREADTETGRVRGLPGNNPRFTAFKGIPYAAPPVGELRWRPPQPAEPWEGVRKCYDFGNDPISFWGSRMNQPRGEKESEDCLYLRRKPQTLHTLAQGTRHTDRTRRVVIEICT